ncbi:MAG: glycosyltransferase [Vicinamibacterales bacterium]
MQPAVETLPVPVLSVVLCTYNRAHLLAGALDALLNQVRDTPPYEVIVVDNNSIDATRDVVGQCTGGVVHYVFEPCQGLSVARNRGVSVARADLIAFTDDDVRVSADWVRSIVRVFDEHHDIDLAGGKIEPVWEAPPPPWLSEAGCAPLALLDFGEEAFRLTPDRPIALIGANAAVRRGAFDRAGGFSPALQRERDGIGSTEDYDFQVRLLAQDGCALYDPRILVRAPVPRERLMKRYHRAWHSGHGRFYALMREPAFERSRLGTVMGVPAHVYRSVVREAAGWAASLLGRRSTAAFAHELRLRFLIAFAVQRMFQRS